MTLEGRDFELYAYISVNPKVVVYTRGREFRAFIPLSASPLVTTPIKNICIRHCPAEYRAVARMVIMLYINTYTRTGNRNVHRTVHFTAVVTQTQSAKPGTRVQRGCVADRHVTLAERQSFARVPVPSSGLLRVTGRNAVRNRHRDSSAVWVPQPAIVDL